MKTHVTFLSVRELVDPVTPATLIEARGITACEWEPRPAHDFVLERGRGLTGTITCETCSMLHELYLQKTGGM